jgi:hypothetical protein
MELNSNVELASIMKKNVLNNAKKYDVLHYVKELYGYYQYKNK